VGCEREDRRSDGLESGKGLGTVIRAEGVGFVREDSEVGYFVWLSFKSRPCT
jgi:hypothetical protein